MIEQVYHHDGTTREGLQENLAKFDVRRQPDGELRRAAVAVTVARQSGEAVVVITRRADQLRDHGGQWALPGGRIDPGESAVETALRELHEEINLALDSTAVLGTLDDYVTRSGYIITPVVVWAERNCQDLEPNPDEVALIASFSFRELDHRDSPILSAIAESDRPVLSMRYRDNVIFAPTGAILYQFREVAMHGRDTRVLEYEQPRFAWR